MFKKFIGLFLILLLFLSLPAAALFVQTGDEVDLAQGTIINDNLFIASGDIDVSGIIRGDLIAFGGEISINGQVDGDVIVVGGDVVIAGSAQNVFVAGGDVTIVGRVRHDLLVGSGDLFLDKNARIGKDAFLGCGQATISGLIGRDLKVGAGTLEITENARIFGKVDYSADDPLISDKAKIVGAITSYDKPNIGGGVGQAVNNFDLARRIISFLAIFILGAVIVMYLPNQVKLVTNEMTNKFWWCLLWGLISLIVIPIAAGILIATMIGIPFAVLLIFGYFFFIYIHGIFSGVLIGQAVFERFGKKKINVVLALLVGLLIIQLLGWIPLIGWAIKLVLFLWAFGAQISTRWPTYKEARKKGVL